MNEKKLKVFKICVKTLQGNFLTYNNVSTYDFDGPMIKFVDDYTGEIKRFAVANCEIVEVTK